MANLSPTLRAVTLLTTILEALGTAAIVVAAWLTSLEVGLAATGAAAIAASFVLTRSRS